MEDYRLEQSGQEVQNILNTSTPQSDLDAEILRAGQAEQALDGKIDAEKERAKAAEKQNADDIDAIEEKIPSGASSSNKFATESDVNDASQTLQGNINAEVLRAGQAEQVIDGKIDAEETRAKAAEKVNADDIDAIEGKIPSGATASNKLATASDVTSEATTRENADAALQQAIEAILLLIPSAASSLNQLADKAFVNSSIATATATFRGTYNLVNDLGLMVSATHAQIATALAGAVVDEDNNDYAFVQIPTSDATPTQIAKTERYKFNGTAWEYEYDLNNSGYTADQWAAINSGITAALVSKLSALPTNAELTTALGLLSDGIAAINSKIPSEATTSNKLVDTAAMQSYITQILGTISATFNVASADGHVAVQITQVNGVITNVAVTTSDIASAAALTLVTGRVTDAEANIVSLGGRMNTAEDDIDDLQQLYNNLQQSAPVVIEPTDTWPVAVADRSATVIYRVVDRVNTPPQYYSDYMFRASDLSGQPVLMGQYDNAIDPRPKKGSQNLVNSGGVFDNMGALDVSELNATENPHTLATYADLSAALAAIPSDYQKGGMSIKFVSSVDNKYVQYRLMNNQWSTTVSDWQGVDDEPTAGSDNLVKSGGVAKLFYGNNSDLYIDGKYINGDGIIATDEDYIISSDIPVKEDDVIVWNPGVVNTSKYLVVYNSDGQKVGSNFSASSTTRTCVLTGYQGASFIRATFAKSNLSNAKLVVNGEQVWHAGTTEKKDGVYESIEVLSNSVETNANNITNEINRAQGVENTLNIEINGNNSILYIDGKYVNNDGNIRDDENDLITSHIPVQIGDTIIWNHGLNNAYTRTLIVFDSSGNKVGSAFSATGNTRTCVITDSFVNASYIIATFAKSNIDNAKIIINDVEVWKPLTTVETNGLKEDTDNLLDEINGNYDQYYVEGKYISGDGKISTNESWGRTGKIPVSEGDIVDWNHCRTQDTSNQRFLVVYDSEGQKIGANFSSTGSERICDLSGYVGASYLMASFELDGINNAYIKINDKEVWRPVTQDYKSGLKESVHELDKRVTALEENPFDINDVIIRNTDKIYPLINACQLHRFTNTSKDLQLSILADVHGYVKPTEHAIKITNGFDTIDAMIAVGDILQQSFTGSFIETYKSLVLNSDKPIYSLMGNHDVGNSKYVGICASHTQIYQTFIEPMIQKGWLVSGEYVQNTGYWYHDFVDNNKGIKVRLIALYEYDDNLDLANSDYWEPVTYNSEYSELQFNTSYSVNDYVNCGNYTDYSFKCKQALTTPANAYTNQSLLPCYIVQRGTRVIRQAQAQWFLNTLYNTPNDYTIVVAMHNPFSDSAVLYTDSIFCQNIPNVTGDSFSQNSMETDFIADAIAAFVNRENYSVNVVMKGNASYLNTEGGGTYAYNVSKDFSQKTDNSKFLCYLGGHTHRDLVFKKDGFYQISPITASLGNEYSSSVEQFDIRREYSNGENVDSLTVISFDTRFNSVGLVKVGANVTNNLLRRDMERLNM